MLVQPEEIVSEPTEPKLMPHHGYRSWTSFWYDAGKKRRCKRFGREGEVTKKRAKARYDHWMQTKWRPFNHVQNPDEADYTIADLARDYLDHARAVYVKNGRPTTHIDTVEDAMEALVNFYGTLPAPALDAPKLAALRDAMIYGPAADGGVRVRAMKTVNNRLFCIKQAFQWAREKGRVAAITLQDVMVVKPLAKGRSPAKDPKEVRPVPEALVRKTMEHLPPVLRDLVEVLWLTGMRPGEGCIMRPCDIDTTGDVWVYTPWTHKTEHKGKTRFVTLGPQAQAILKPYLARTLKTDAYLFAPAEADAQRRAERAKRRKTPSGQGNAAGTNVKDEPRRKPGDVYTDESLRKAIHHACELAFEMPKEWRVRHKGDTAETMREKSQKRFAWRRQWTWNPNQIRHAWATRIRKQFGIEEASVGLGHHSLDTTEIYAERDMEKSKDVARRVG